MANYIIGGLIAVLVFLAVRSYFGNKYGSGCGSGCGNCPYSGKCHTNKQIKD